MVKSYLRYRFRTDFGVVASPESNIVLDSTGSCVLAGANEFVYKWNLRTTVATTKLSVADVSPDAAPGYVTRVCRHPTASTLLAVGYSNGAVRIWDTESKSLVVTFHGHKTGISALEFSLDGHLLASGGWDTDIVVWDITSHSGLYRLRGHQNRVEALRFAYAPRFDDTGPAEALPKGKRRKKTATNYEHHDSSEADDPSSFVELGREPCYIVSGSRDGTVKIWDLATQWCLQTIFDSSGDVCSVMIDPATNRLFVGSADHQLKIYKLRYGGDKAGDVALYLGAISRPSGRGRATQIFSALDAPAAVSEFALLAQTMETLTLSSREVARVAERVTQLGTILTGTDTQVALRNTRRLFFVVCPGSRAIEVYRHYPPSEQLRKMQKRKRRAQEKLKKKQSRLIELKASFDELDRQCGQGKRTALGTTFDAEKEAVMGQITLVTEEMETLKADSTADVPHISDSLDYVHTFFLRKKPVAVDYVSLSATLVVSYSDNIVESFKVPIQSLIVKKNHGKLTEDKPESVDDELVLSLLQRLDSLGHAAPPLAACVSHDDSMIASLSDKALHLWRTDTATLIRRIELPDKVLCGFFVAGNQHFVAGTAKGSLLLIDIVACTVLQTHETQSRVVAIAEHPKKTGFVSAGEDKTLQFFQFYVTKDTGKNDLVAFKHLVSHDVMDVPLNVQFSGDGRLVAVALLDFTLQVFYTDSLKLFLTLYGHKLPCPSISFSSDCTLLASGSNDKTIKIWGLDFGNIQKSWHAHDEGVMFLPDTHYLASTGKDCLLKLWDTDRRDLICQFSGHIRPVVCLTCTRLDADRLITGGLDGSLRVWERTDEQLFPEEEKEKLLDTMLDAEAARADLPISGQEVTMTRATRKTIDSIRSTEQLMEAIDAAFTSWKQQREYTEALTTWKSMQEGAKRADQTTATSLTALQPLPAPTAPENNPRLMGLSPEHFLFEALSKISASLTHEVVIALPFSFAEKLLSAVSDIIEMMDAATADSAGMYALEPIARIALLTVHVHMRQLLVSPTHREMLLKLHTFLRPLLLREKERVEFSQRAVALLQKRAIENSTVVTAP